MGAEGARGFIDFTQPCKEPLTQDAMKFSRQIPEGLYRENRQAYVTQGRRAGGRLFTPPEALLTESNVPGVY